MTGWRARAAGGLAGLALLVVVIAAVSLQRFSAPGPLTQPATVVIPKGAGMAAMADLLAAAGVIRDRWSFLISVRLKGARIKAGEYLFPAAISGAQVVEELAEGHTVIHKLTVAEGLTVRRVLDEVRQADYLAGTLTIQPAEGSLLPETWHLSRDDLRDEVVERMHQAMEHTVQAAWAERAANLPLANVHEALVLASIVERETAIAGERPHVAAVFENRLKKGMKLQSDPTVIYGLSGGLGVLDRPLQHEDLEKPSPWNTYVIDGLPPTPIANPGKASLEAVLHPSASDDLYFVADGSGGHVFARTLEQHNANVTRWRRIESHREK